MTTIYEVVGVLTKKVDGVTVSTRDVTLSTAIDATPPAPPTIDTFSSDLSTVDSGDAVELTVATTGATSASIDQGVGSVAVDGVVTVNPTTSTTYTLTATGPGGTVTATVDITVNAAVVVDPFAANVVSLVRANTPGSATLTDDVAGNVWVAHGGATQTALNDANRIEGAASMDFTTNDGTRYFECTTPELLAALAFGTGDFCVEITLKGGTPPTFFTGLVATDLWALRLRNGAAELEWDGESIAASGLASGTAHRVRLQRASNVLYFFVDGTLIDSTAGNSNNWSAPAYLRIGSSGGATQPYVGYLDEMRITKANRGTATYTDLAPNESMPSLTGGGGGSVPEGDVLMSLSGPQVTVQTTDRPVQTSAGVYDSSGKLLRTLWRRVLLDADDTHVMTWDYTDDLGATVADGAYTVKVLAHNVDYEWQGVIGNNTNPGLNGITQKSYNFGGQNISMPVVSNFYRAFCGISDMKFAANGVGFCCNGYNEQQNAMFTTTVANPKQRTIVGHDDFQRVFQLVATDGVRGYFANTGAYDTANPGSIFDNPVNFIVAFQPNGTEVSFSSGSAWTTGAGPGNYWNSCIDIVTDGVDQITGIAVETSGSNLYVAHKNTGIKVFNKTTGAFVRSYSVPNPSLMALAPSGDLYVIVNGGTEVRRYTSPASASTHNQAITGFGNATGIGVSPVTSTVVVVDSGTDSRLKAFNSSGTAVWQHGAVGGYSDGDPTVLPTRFNFLDNDGPYNYIAFEPAVGSQEFFWMGEPGNQRNLRFEIPSGATGTNPLVYKDHISYLKASYRSAVNKTDPTRVFSEWKEYSVDYAQELTASWTLVKNWGVGLSDSFRKGFGPGIEDCITYPNGRTYAIGTSQSGRRIYELTATALRDTGITVADGDRLAEDGSLRSTLDSGGLYQVRQKSFTGLDGSGNPQFSAAATVATGPKLDSRGKKNPYCFSAAIRQSLPKTGSGLYVSFNPNSSLDGTGDGDPALYHLGALAAGTNTDFKFRASPAGTFTFNGSLIINGDGTFNTADMSQPGYGGSIAMTAGNRHIVYNYFGEFWNNGQACQWMHWLDNGLFIGQWGVPNYPSNNKGDSAIVGTIGNSFSGSMVEADGEIYVYSNDESCHGGVHRFRLAGLDTLQEMVGNVGRNTSVSNPSQIPSVAITP